MYDDSNACVDFVGVVFRRSFESLVRCVGIYDDSIFSSASLTRLRYIYKVWKAENSIDFSLLLIVPFAGICCKQTTLLDIYRSERPMLN